MAMSKKDYQNIARAIHQTEVKALGPLNREDEKILVLGMTHMLSRALAEVCASDNPRFNCALFIEACETGKCKGMPK